MEENVLIHPLGFLHFMMCTKVNLSLCIIILYASTPTPFLPFIIFLLFSFLYNFVYDENRRHDCVRGDENLGIFFSYLVQEINLRMH